MHKLMRYIKGYEKQAVLAPLFKMLEATFELFVPLVVASIIDTGIKNGDAVFIWQRCGLPDSAGSYRPDLQPDGPVLLPLKRRWASVPRCAGTCSAISTR